jgi:hypothetical protein
LLLGVAISYYYCSRLNHFKSDKMSGDKFLTMLLPHFRGKQLMIIDYRSKLR